MRRRVREQGKEQESAEQRVDAEEEGFNGDMDGENLISAIMPILVIFSLSFLWSLFAPWPFNPSYNHVTSHDGASISRRLEKESMADMVFDLSGKPLRYGQDVAILAVIVNASTAPAPPHQDDSTPDEQIMYNLHEIANRLCSYDLYDYVQIARNAIVAQEARGIINPAVSMQVHVKPTVRLLHADAKSGCGSDGFFGHEDQEDNLMHGEPENFVRLSLPISLRSLAPTTWNRWRMWTIIDPPSSKPDSHDCIFLHRDANATSRRFFLQASPLHRYSYFLKVCNTHHDSEWDPDSDFGSASHCKPIVSYDWGGIEWACSASSSTNKPPLLVAFSTPSSFPTR